MRGGQGHKVQVLQHFPCETLGTIAEAIAARGIIAVHARTFEGQPVPKGLGEAAGLIVMGGPMGVYEQSRYPFLRDEMRLIESALRAKKPVLGVCLGSQLLAAVLGAPVAPGRQKEIGWHVVTLDRATQQDPLWTGAQSRFVAFHWHGDAFPVPPGAVGLASSALTECQAFRYAENAYGLLFHLEVTAAGIAEMVECFGDEARAAGASGAEILAGRADHLSNLHETAATVFGRWADTVLGESGETAGH